MNLQEELTEIKRLMRRSEWAPAYSKLAQLEAKVSNRSVTIEAKRKMPVEVKDVGKEEGN